MAHAFPHQPEDLTAAWISEKIGAPVNDFTIEQIGVGVGLLGRLYRLTLTGDASTPASVVAKFPTLDEGRAPTSPGRRASIRTRSTSTAKGRR